MSMEDLWRSLLYQLGPILVNLPEGYLLFPLNESFVFGHVHTWSGKELDFSHHNKAVTSWTQMED